MNINIYHNTSLCLYLLRIYILLCWLRTDRTTKLLLTSPHNQIQQEHISLSSSVKLRRIKIFTFVIPGQVKRAWDVDHSAGRSIWPAGISVKCPVTEQAYRTGYRGMNEEREYHSDLTISLFLHDYSKQNEQNHCLPWRRGSFSMVLAHSSLYRTHFR